MIMALTAVRSRLNSFDELVIPGARRPERGLDDIDAAVRKAGDFGLVGSLLLSRHAKIKFRKRRNVRALFSIIQCLYIIGFIIIYTLLLSCVLPRAIAALRLLCLKSVIQATEIKFLGEK